MESHTGTPSGKRTFTLNKGITNALSMGETLITIDTCSAREYTLGKILMNMVNEGII